MSQYGVQETKQVLDLAFAGAKAVQDALADGKIGLEDLGQLLPIIVAAGPAIDNISMVPKEIKDLDAAEAADLMLYMKKHLDPMVGDAELQEKIEKGLALALALVEFLLTFKSADPQPVPVNPVAPVPSGAAAKP